MLAGATALFYLVGLPMDFVAERASGWYAGSITEFVIFQPGIMVTFVVGWLRSQEDTMTSTQHPRESAGVDVAASSSRLPYVALILGILSVPGSILTGDSGSPARASCGVCRSQSRPLPWGSPRSGGTRRPGGRRTSGWSSARS